MIDTQRYEHFSIATCINQSIRINMNSMRTSIHTHTHPYTHMSHICICIYIYTYIYTIDIYTLDGLKQTSPFRRPASGEFHGVALTSSGQVLCWGQEQGPEAGLRDVPKLKGAWDDLWMIWGNMGNEWLLMIIRDYYCNGYWWWLLMIIKGY